MNTLSSVSKKSGAKQVAGPFEDLSGRQPLRRRIPLPRIVARSANEHGGRPVLDGQDILRVDRALCAFSLRSLTTPMRRSRLRDDLIFDSEDLAGLD
jgi:hypothetical protein